MMSACVRRHWVGDSTVESLHEVKMHFVIAFGGATTHKIALVLTFLLLRSYFANVITVHLKSWCKSMWRLTHNGHKHLDISRLTTQPSL